MPKRTKAASYNQSLTATNGRVCGPEHPRAKGSVRYEDRIFYVDLCGATHRRGEWCGLNRVLVGAK